MDPRNSIVDKLVNNCLGALLLVHDSGCLAHQEGAGIVHCLVIDIVTSIYKQKCILERDIRVVGGGLPKSLEIMLNWNDTLARELLDFSSSVVLPVRDVCVVSYSQWSTSEDNCADVVIMASSSDSLLVSLWCTSLISQDESSSNPDRRGTEHKSSGNSLTIVNATSSNNLYWLSSHWAGLALDELDNGWDQDGCWHISSVSTSLTTLCADDINAEFEALLHMLGVANHVHVEDAGLVESLDNMLGRNTDGRDEQFCARVDDDAYEFVELALCVIIAVRKQRVSNLISLCKLNASTSLGM